MGKLRKELKARPLAEWHEDIGDVLWWRFPIDEAPYVGSPLDLGQTVEVTLRSHSAGKTMRAMVGGWPGYHTHWTPIITPLVRTDGAALKKAAGRRGRPASGRVARPSDRSEGAQ